MDWNIGLIFIVICCFLLSQFLLKVKSTGTRILMILFGPYVLSFSLYWILAIFEGKSSEHGSWSGIFIYPWAAAGIISMLIGLFVFSRVKERKGDNA